MPGVGKSYWAEKIAEHHNLQYVDLDHIIEVRCRMSIPEIFKQFGHERFRILEAQTLDQVLTVFSQGMVMACGGGTPCYHHNMQSLLRNGMVVYLEAPLEYLCANLEQERHTRPLLQQADWKQQLGQMLEQRAPVYRQAHRVLDASIVNMDTFESIIALCRNKAH